MRFALMSDHLCAYVRVPYSHRASNWSPPELVTTEQLDLSAATYSSDVWSLAMVISEIFSGKVPFTGDTEGDMVVMGDFKGFRTRLDAGYRPSIPTTVAANCPWLPDAESRSSSFTTQGCY
jgi:serine/threonine protein kinase